MAPSVCRWGLTADQSANSCPACAPAGRNAKRGRGEQFKDLTRNAREQRNAAHMGAAGGGARLLGHRRVLGLLHARRSRPPRRRRRRPGRPGGPMARYFAFDPQSVSDAIASLAGVNAAVFGIVITVVSIIVQLTADRYTGVARMFLRDRINVAGAGLLRRRVRRAASGSRRRCKPTTCRAPRWSAMLSMTTGGLVLMAPVLRLRVLVPRAAEHHRAASARTPSRRAANGARRTSTTNDCCAAPRPQTLFALEELTDITSNSISGKDKIIASGAVDALKDLALEYLKVKPQATEAWFSIGPEIRLNPDFVAMDPESLARSRSAPHLGRVEGDAPVPQHLQRSARLDARHQLPDRDRHPLHRRGRRRGQRRPS